MDEKLDGERDEELLENIEYILDLSSGDCTERDYRIWKRVLLQVFFDGDTKGIPETENRYAPWDFEGGIGIMKKVLDRLPPDVLGEDVKWDKVCYGFLTRQQKRNLQKYYDEHRKK